MFSTKRSFLLFILLFSTALLCAAKDAVKDLPPRYRTWLTDEVNYIINNDERNVFLSLSTDQERDKFIEQFWEVRNPTPGAPTNPYKEEIYKRIEYAKAYLGGVHTAMGQIYITLGEPKQRAKYYGRSEVRPMEIWFYENTNPALPPYFYIVFFDRDNTGTMRLYSPYMDGPSKLSTSVLTVNDNRRALQAIERALGREVARTTLSLLPGGPVDLQNGNASLESDVLLGIVKNLANNPLTKQELEQKRLAERVTHRVVLNEEFIDVLTIPLRDSTGNFNLHYLVRLHRPSDFAIEEANGKVFYNIQFSARVFGPDNKILFQQEKNVSRYLEGAELERMKHSLFGYEDWLALAPGKYRIEFVFTNKLNKTAYRAEREIVMPGPGEKGMRLSPIIAFSKAEAAGSGNEYLPFTVGGVRFTPLTGDALTYAPGHDINLFYQVWAPPTDPKSLIGKKLTVNYVYGRVGATGDSKSIHDEVAEDQFDVFGSMVTGKKITLSPDAGSGNYRLVVSVADVGSEKVYSSLNFRVSSLASAAPVFDIYAPDLSEEVSKGLPEFDRALCYLAQNDKDSAIRWFKASLAKNPTNEIARSRLAELYYDREAYADVAALFSRTPITGETDEQAILRGAESMAKTGSLNHAISLLENAITFRKTSRPLYLALANYYRDEGNTEKATQLETKGRELTKE